jgi:cytochrome P450
MVDTEIAGCPVKRGDLVQVLTPSAGRDEHYYAHADVVDFSRSKIKHIAFGVGPHRCLGSHLARMELRVALEEISAVMPEFSVSNYGSNPRHWGNVAGLDRLDVSVG